ncbi:MAG: peptide deformylase, partial [Acidobacteriota bacterium]
MFRSILQKDAPLLKKSSEPVAIKDIASPRVQNLIRDMRETLEREEDGVALAAPQIGVLDRIFVVSPRAFLPRDREIPPEEYATLAAALRGRERLVYINPEIVKLSKQKKIVGEGCLSVGESYGAVERATRATIRAYDENGVRYERGGSGLLAQIFQHECDHLDGILFI